MIKIILLKEEPRLVSMLANWEFENWGRFTPDATLEDSLADFQQHLNDDQLPLSLVVLDNQIPVGMASLRINDGLRPDLKPWLVSLYVIPSYRNQGLGKQLVHSLCDKAKALGYKALYLYILDPDLLSWYRAQGWEFISFELFNGHLVKILRLDL